MGRSGLRDVKLDLNKEQSVAENHYECCHVAGWMDGHSHLRRIPEWTTGRLDTGQCFSAGNRTNKIINYEGSAHTEIQLNGKINGRGGAHHNNDIGNRLNGALSLTISSTIESRFILISSRLKYRNVSSFLIGTWLTFHCKTIVYVTRNVIPIDDAP